MTILTNGTYYGSMKSEYRINGIILSEYDYVVKQTDWHYHENPYFMYVLNGNLYDINKKRKSVCTPGSFLLHNWQEQHYNSKESTYARGFHIELERNWFLKNEINIDLWQGSTTLHDPKLHRILSKIYAEFIQMDELSSIFCELLLCQLCENIHNEKVYRFENKPTWLPALIEILHHGNETLSLGNLAKILGIHPGHLSRAVPKYFSTTLGDYIRQLKIKKAIECIISTNKSVQDITFECGFSDQSHFIRTFKKYMGTTPHVFIQKCR